MKKTCVSIILTAIIFLILLVHVNYLRFVCDDAFISFRYAKNFIEGHGLVYNIGERVEGYTNFLWTLLLSLFMRMGFDPVVVSQVLGIWFSLATILLLLRINRWLYPSPNLFNYLAPLLLACCGAYAAWSTGGLETSFFTFLIMLGSYFLITGINKTTHFIFSGITFAFVGMTRLDGVIFGGVTFLFVLYLAVVQKKIELKNLLLWIISFLIPFLVYFFWRWSYYEKFLPNTFYVKVGEESLYHQGLVYLFDFVKRFWIWIMVIPLAFLGKALRSNVNLKMIIPYFVSLILVFSFYVIHVGGDFMDMFRFLVPILPFFFFLVQEGFRGMYFYPPIFLKKKPKMILGILEICLIVLSMFFLAYPSKESNKVWYRNGIDSIGLLREYAHIWSKVGLMFKDVAKPGESLSTTAAGAIPYYSELYTIDELGLTLKSPSGLEVRKTHRSGHYKVLVDEFLLSLKPTYIIGHPQIQDEFNLNQGVWSFSELLLEAGYNPIVFTIKISESKNKYLYCLSLKKSYSEVINHPSP